MCFARMERLFVLLAMLAAAPACGEPLLVGRECADGSESCNEAITSIGRVSWPGPLPVPEGCHHSLSTLRSEVEDGDNLEYCEIIPIPGSTRQFVTEVELLIPPDSHHVSVRWGPTPAGLGLHEEIDCVEARERVGDWQPLVSSPGEHTPWTFSNGAFLLQPGTALFVNIHYVNRTGQTVTAGAEVLLHCVEQPPAVSLMQFEAKAPGEVPIPPGESRIVRGQCRFQRDVQVSLLYRFTHWRDVSRFSARGLDDGLEIYPPDANEALELKPPRAFRAGQGLAWECLYENTSENTFTVGGTEPQVCSLFGVYQLPSGELDLEGEPCQPVDAP